MAKVFLDANDEFVISGPATIYGSTGIEKLQIANGATGVVLDSAVERIELAGASTAYNYKIEGTQITVYSGTTEVASFAGGNNPILAFSDGSAAVAMTGLGTATLGGVAIPTAAAPITPTVDAADPSTAPGVAGTFSLTADAASVNEGATATFTVAHGQPNQTYNYELTGVDATDVVDGLLTGSITTDTNGSATFSVALANDRTTEGVETLKATLPNTGLSATVTVNDTSLDNVAPVAQDATAKAVEGGAVVTGQLVATDVDDAALTFAAVTPVAGLTINADGTYSFDPAKNDDVKALTTAGGSKDLVATYTVKDTLGLTDTGTLTITAAPEPLSFKIEGASTVNEDGAITFTVTANEAVTAATEVVFTLVPGDNAAADQGTATTNLNDFSQGSFNPVTVVIPADGTKATFSITPPNDDLTELAESFSVQAVVGSQTLTATASLLDGATGGGKTYMLTKDQDVVPGTAGNDVVNGLVNLAASAADASTTFNGFDQINGGAGVNTFKLAVSGVMTSGTPYTVSLANIEKIQVVEINNTATGDTVKVDASAVADLTDLKVTKSTSGIELTGSDTQNITTAGTADAITIKGGKDVTVTDGTAAKNIVVSNSGATGNAAGAITVTDSKQTSGTIDVDGGTTVNVTATTDKATSGAITVGASKAATGAVTVTQNVTNDAATAITAGNIAVTGGATVTVNKNLTNTATKDSGAANNITAGTVTVTGDSKTTAVTVNQVNVANDYAAVTTGATAETSAITFASLKSGEKIAISAAALTALGTDLTFTAGKDLTAAEVAAAFANLINGDKQTAGGKVANGVWTGALDAGWTSGAVSGSTVTFTATSTGDQTNEITLTVKKADGTTNVDNLADFTTVKVDGSAGTSTTARDVTATMGAVTIEDNATAAITDVTVNGYGTLNIGTTQELTKLANVSLANSGGTATIDGAAGITSLNLTVNNVNNAVDISTNSSAVKTLAVTATGANSTFGLTAAQVETLTVAGDKVLDIDTGSTLTALKTVTVTGSAGLSIDASGANVTSVNTTATTGAVTATINGTKATYTGGAGVDNVTLDTGLALTKAIDLGAGNDTLSFAALAVTGSTALLSGGADTDTLSMAVATADALDGIAQTFYTGFERLTLNNKVNLATADVTIDLANLGFTNYVTTSGTDDTDAGANNKLILDKMASGGTVVLTGTMDNSSAGIQVNVKNATTGTADVLNVINQVANGGTLTAAGVETINLTQNTADGALTLTAADATSLNITASKTLGLTLTGSTDLTLIDGSASTAAITVTSVNTTAATTIKGGSGNDVLTAGTGTTHDVLIGGAGNDTLQGDNLTSLTGGADNDTFIMNKPANVNSYSSIADLAAGDVIDLDAANVGSVVFSQSAIVLAGTAVFQDYANAAVNALGIDPNNAAWFQLDGHTYIVQSGNTISGNDFVNGSDSIIQIVGAVDLSTASYNQTQGTLEIV